MKLNSSIQKTLGKNSSIQKRGNLLSTISDKVGCGVYRFEKTGRDEIEALIRNGLNPWDKFLDIGCGAFCGGYWVMHFLDIGLYHGIEPNIPMFEGGLSHILEPNLVELKKPFFDHNDQYDFSVFNTTFDYMFAQSIWTHAGKKDIEKKQYMQNLCQKYSLQAEFIESTDGRSLSKTALLDVYSKERSII